MLNVLAVTAPIYLLIAVGFLAVRRGVFQRSDMQLLGRLLVPLLLLRLLPLLLLLVPLLLRLLPLLLLLLRPAGLLLAPLLLLLLPATLLLLVLLVWLLPAMQRLGAASSAVGADEIREPASSPDLVPLLGCETRARILYRLSWVTRLAIRSRPQRPVGAH